MALLTLHRVSAHYGGRQALRAVSGTLHAGEIIGVCGPNGAGKSTLLRVLAGLQSVSEGSIAFRDKTLHGLSLRMRAQAIGYLPQTPSHAWPVTIRELAALGRFPHTDSGHLLAHDERAIDTALETLRLTALQHRGLDTVSGGERMRAHLARLLAGEHTVLLVDEPVAALDPELQIATLALLQICARRGATVLAALHDLNLVSRFCDRVLVMRAGEIVADGQPTAALDDAVLSEVFNVQGIRVPDSGQLVGVTFKE